MVARPLPARQFEVAGRCVTRITAGLANAGIENVLDLRDIGERGRPAVKMPDIGAPSTVELGGRVQSSGGELRVKLPGPSGPATVTVP